jgi:hypothetical protein
MRTMAAFYVAPLAVPLITAVYLASHGGPEGVESTVVVVSALVAYAGTFVFGVPLYLFLRARNLTAFWIAPVFGFIVGAIVMFLLVGRDVSPANLQFGGLCGAVVGTILLVDRAAGSSGTATVMGPPISGHRHLTGNRQARPTPEDRP